MWVNPRRLLGDGCRLGGLIGVDILHEFITRDGLLGQEVEGYLVQEAAVIAEELLGVRQHLARMAWTSWSICAAVVWEQSR